VSACKAPHHQPAPRPLSFHASLIGVVSVLTRALAGATSWLRRLRSGSYGTYGLGTRKKQTSVNEATGLRSGVCNETTSACSVRSPPPPPGTSDDPAFKHFRTCVLLMVFSLFVQARYSPCCGLPARSPIVEMEQLLLPSFNELV
jgi:hypothetical protein